MAERIVEEAEFLEQPASTWTQEYLKGIGLGCLGILILTALLFGARFILGKEQQAQEHTLPQSGSRSSPKQERRRGRHEKT